MAPVVTYLDPQPAPDELPAVFASPFDHAVPHPIARRAADELAAILRAGTFAIDLAALDAPGGGKMFGVLVVTDRDGRIGYLRAFSGMMASQWELPGFAPPLFDAVARDAMWPAGQAVLRAHELALRALETSVERADARAALVAHDARATQELAAVDARHRINRARRRSERDQLEATRAADARAARETEANRAAGAPDNTANAATDNHVTGAPDKRANAAADNHVAGVPDMRANDPAAADNHVAGAPDNTANAATDHHVAGAPDTRVAERTPAGVPDMRANAPAAADNHVAGAPDTRANAAADHHVAGVPDMRANAATDNHVAGAPDTRVAERTPAGAPETRASNPTVTGVPDASAVAARLHALDQESRGDAAERKRFEAAVAEVRGPLAERVAAFERERMRLERLRADESRDLMKRVHDTYVISNARGERMRLRELFAPGEPPAGAGDCAGPKLLGEAYRHGLTPLALAEVWWGAPPATGGRHAGTFYPSCRGKCGPILPHMLDGLPVSAPPVFGGGPIATELPAVVFEDAWIVVVDKPVGLLSVPGRSGALRDSVQTRLRARYPEATGPLVVHRLDLDTSGLLLAAKDEGTHAALQAQFARRQIEKRYIAWLDGVVAADAGVVDLPIRVDLDDRPRQIHDPVHGKGAITEWSVLERGERTTRVALVPKTGRTHQLRVHAAHPRGIGAPIVGDRLYGRSAQPEIEVPDAGLRGAGYLAAPIRGDEVRLMLHAERLAFVHPHTGERIELSRAAPF